MPLRRFSLVLCLALAGCPSTPVGPASIPGERIVGSVAPTATPSTADLVGTLVAPPGLVAVPASKLVSDQTGSLVSDQTGSLVSDQTGSIVSDQTGSMALLALSEAALGKTTVYLADATLKPIAGLKPVETDAAGQFSFKGVPAGFTFQVVAVVKTAQGKLGRLSTLAKPGEAAAISAASTLVAASVVAADGGLPGTVDAPVYAQAIAAARAKLTPETVPDFADTKAVVARGAALEGADATLGALFQQLRAKLATHPPLADIQVQLPKPTPAAVATPTPVAAATPTPAPVSTAAPAAVATPTAAATPQGNSDFILGGTPSQCGPSVAHEVVLVNSYQNYPLTLVVLAPDTQVVAKCAFPTATAIGLMTIPEGCPHGWKLVDANGITVANPPPFSVVVGASKRLFPPF
ncbi:MAG: hypothetical protein JWM80_5929 [Cyanobacteria bacterium RYN_339]|nr:hypothetical protein [Cyanobacteria bacterium RYN_339]